MIVRVVFNVRIAYYMRMGYDVGVMYDLELTDELSELIRRGLADHIPFPPSDTLA